MASLRNEQVKLGSEAVAVANCMYRYRCVLRVFREGWWEGAGANVYMSNESIPIPIPITKVRYGTELKGLCLSFNW